MLQIKLTRKEQQLTNSQKEAAKRQEQRQKEIQKTKRG